MRWLWLPRRFRTFERDYPLHQSHAYGPNGRPILPVYVGDQSVDCVVDTGAYFVVFPFERFLDYEDCVDGNKRNELGTARADSKLVAYPLKGGAEMYIRLGNFTFFRPAYVLFSNHVDHGILGRHSILGPYAFMFEQHVFHVFARER